MCNVFVCVPASQQINANSTGKKREAWSGERKPNPIIEVVVVWWVIMAGYGEYLLKFKWKM